MGKIIRIGMDTSKSVFQLHGVDESEQPVLRRKLRRKDVLGFFGKLEPVTIGIEACASSHYWSRELTKLGHKVVLIPPRYVKAYVTRNKNDKIDAEAICEAMSRPKVQRRFVPIKSVEQQALQMTIGVRSGLMKRRTQVSNAIRGFAAEFGLVTPKGLVRIDELLARIKQSADLPEQAREAFLMLEGQFCHVEAQIKQAEARLKAQYRKNELSHRLSAVPTIGIVGAVAFSAKASDAKRFASGRDFSAFLGITPKDHSTAGKKRLGVITRAGDEMLRSLLVCGATAVIQQVKRGRSKPSPWLKDLIAKKPEKLAAVALANKTARIVWKLIVSGETYDPNHNVARSSALANEAVDMWATHQGNGNDLVASPT